MVLHRHQDLERASPAPGLFRIIVMDEKLGSGAITQGMVRLEPGRQTRPHTHRVEESMDLVGTPGLQHEFGEHRPATSLQ